MTYRLLSHLSNGEPRGGVLVDDTIYDLPGKASVLELLQDWPKAKGMLGKAPRGKGTPLKKAKLLAPILYPGNIYCAGANYRDHVAEMERAQGREPGPTMKERGEKPWHFVKTSKSSVVGPGAKVKLPAFSKAVDWEVELAAVIGRRAKEVSVDKALGCVAGWTIANDLSARDAMRRELNPPTSPFHYDWVSQKCFDGACPLGPWIVPASEIKDPQNLDMVLTVNGEVRQKGNTKTMIFDCAHLVWACSQYFVLEPGDVIITGTPAGVGMAMDPRRFLASGDVVRIEIERLGAIEHAIA